MGESWGKDDSVSRSIEMRQSLARKKRFKESWAKIYQITFSWGKNNNNSETFHLPKPIFKMATWQNFLQIPSIILFPRSSSELAIVSCLCPASFRTMFLMHGSAISAKMNGQLSKSYAWLSVLSPLASMYSLVQHSDTLHFLHFLHKEQWWHLTRGQPFLTTMSSKLLWFWEIVGGTKFWPGYQWCF